MVHAGTANGGGLFVRAASLEIRQTEFSSNSVSANSASGAAIYLSGAGVSPDPRSRPDVVIECSSFRDNEASGVGGAIATASAYAPNVVVTNSTFEGNNADIGGAISIGQGGGSFTITGSVFSGNGLVADTVGAAIHVGGTPDVTLSDSCVAGDGMQGDIVVVAGVFSCEDSSVTTEIDVSDTATFNDLACAVETTDTDAYFAGVEAACDSE